MKSYDVVIIGSGCGGGSVALQLAGSGARTLILERGQSLPREAQNSDPEAVFGQRRYHTDETWWADNEAFKPGMFYYVGGNTKFYGSAMFRFRERDFAEVEHEEGVSPAWPIAYADLEPWYEQAETLFGVHGRGGADPTDPIRSKDFDHAPVPHEPVMQAVEHGRQRRFTEAGQGPRGSWASVGAGRFGGEEGAFMTGLDTAQGLKRASGKPGLYAELLQRFALSQSDVVQNLQAAIQAEDWALAERTAHSTGDIRSATGEMGQRTDDALHELVADADACPA